MGGEVRAVTWTERKIVRVSLLANGAGLHGRVGYSPVGRSLTEVWVQWDDDHMQIRLLKFDMGTADGGARGGFMDGR